MSVIPDLLSEEFVVVATKILVEDEIDDPVKIHAQVADGPTYDLGAPSLLEAIGQLATLAAKDAATDEAIEWDNRIREGRVRLLIEIPRLVADRLLINGSGETAARLVMESSIGRDLGGWSRFAVEDATRGVLRALLKEE